MRKIKHNLLALLVWLFLLTPLLTGCATTQPHDDNSGYQFLANSNSDNVKARKGFWAKVRPMTTMAAAHYRLGRFQQKQGKHAEAIVSFNKAVRINPLDVKSYNALGISHDALRQPRAAQKAYEQAIALAPTLAYPYNNLGCSFLLKGDIDSAIASFVKAAELDVHTPRIKNNLAVALRKAEQRDLREEQQALIARRPEESAAEPKNNSLKKLRELTVSSKTFHSWEPVVATVSTESESLEPSEEQPVGQDVAPVNEPTTPASPVVSMSQAPKAALIVEENNNVAATKPWPATAESVTLHTLHNVPLEVSNGNGVTGMARNTADYFKKQGLKIRRITNAENFNFATTKIVYQKGYLAQAYQLARLIPGLQDLECLPTLNHPEVKVKLILGKDISTSSLAEIAAFGDAKKARPGV